MVWERGETREIREIGEDPGDKAGKLDRGENWRTEVVSGGCDDGQKKFWKRLADLMKTKTLLYGC